MRARTNIALKERKVFKLDNFRGVDFSASPLDVQSNRAVDMRNFINKNGINCKRNGWRQVLGFKEDIIINGIFNYRNKDDDEWLIVHAGGSFYKVWKGSFIKEKIKVADNVVILAQRSEGYFRDGRLYIVGAGDYLVYGTWDDGENYEIRRVEDDEDTYIPTTTININCMSDSENDVQGTLDEPNLLCGKRVNRLVGKELTETDISGGIVAQWMLDSPIEENTEVTVKVEKFEDQGKITEVEYVNDLQREDKTVLYKKGTNDKAYGEIDWDTGIITLNFSTKTNSNMDNIYVTFTASKKEKEYKTKVLTPEECNKSQDYENYISSITLNEEIRTDKLIEVKTIKKGKVIDWIENTLRKYEWIDDHYECVGLEIGKPHMYDQNKRSSKYVNGKNLSITKVASEPIDSANGHIPIACYPMAITADIDYLVLKYYPVISEDEKKKEDDGDEFIADDINKCTFGTLFGVYGNTDRLFLSGNPDRPNMDFYSAADDYTYFTASQCAVLGSDASAVGGYTRLSDSTLAIFKENADREASIYFRTGKLNEEYDSEGNLEDGSAVFPLTAGALGETIVSRYSCANFAGDNIMLSRNGVHGIVLGENVVLTERHTRERSRAINKRLLAHRDLSEAVGVVFENRYYLAVDGVCYVADTRYKYKRKDDIDGSYNYEWWFLDNIPARIWAVIDGKLYFGTSDGKICVFDDEYTDRTFIETEVGDLTFSNGYAEITYNNKALKEGFADGDEFEILHDGVYALYYNVADIKEGKILTSSEDILKIYEGTEVYADNVGDSVLAVDVKYVVSNVDVAGNTFSLKTEDGMDVMIASTSTPAEVRLCRLISGEKLKVINKDKTEGAFEIALRGDEGNSALQTVDYNGTLPSEITARITHKKKIEAEWRTPTFDLGTNMASKTILGITATSDPQFDGNVSIGYDTRFYRGSFDVRGNRVFSFDDFDFLDFSFDTGFATSYTRRLNKRNVNYVSFGFKSTDDRCCAVNSLAVLYKINKNNRGVN